MIYGTVDYSKNIGSTFKIKYNPQSPNESTHILSPSVLNLIFGIISSGFFIVCSLTMVGIIKAESIAALFKKGTADRIGVPK